MNDLAASTLSGPMPAAPKTWARFSTALTGLCILTSKLWWVLRLFRRF